MWNNALKNWKTAHWTKPRFARARWLIPNEKFTTTVNNKIMIVFSLDFFFRHQAAGVKGPSWFSHHVVASKNGKLAKFCCARGRLRRYALLFFMFQDQKKLARKTIIIIFDISWQQHDLNFQSTANRYLLSLRNRYSCLENSREHERTRERINWHFDIAFCA